MTTSDYDSALTMREVRERYFEANAFGDDGGYNDAWVNIKLGPLPVSFPNTQGRVRAVRYHDLHHVLTGYDTDMVGEFEISAWEIGAGCKDFYAAWFLNLSGIMGGLLRCPLRTFRAFLNGRASESLYGQELEPLLDATLAEVRERMHCPSATPKARPSDFLWFSLSAAAGLVLGHLFMALATSVTPFVLARSMWQQRKLARASASATA